MSNLLWILLFLKMMGKIQTWDLTEKTVTINRPVQNQYKKLNSNIKIKELYHKKMHFEIIIAKNTNLTINVKSIGNLNNLYFYCLNDLSYWTVNILNYQGELNSTKTISSLYDCVPMISFSNKDAFQVTIKTKNWTFLPVLNYFEVKETFELKIIENDFLNEIDTYGFVDSYYIQIFLSKRDALAIKNKYNLIDELKIQANVIRYFNNLIANVDEENQTIFLRSIQCHPDVCEDNFYNIKDSIITTLNITEFFTNKKEDCSSSLLQQIGRFYEVKYFNRDAYITEKVWLYIFIYFYSLKAKSTISIHHIKGIVWNERIPYNEWNFLQKVKYFLYLFDIDGNKNHLIFREFNNRYLQQSKNKFSDIISILVQVFLEYKNVNILPYLNKANFTLMENSNSREHYNDLKIRLMCVEKFELKFISHSNGTIIINIKSPISINGLCLYINNNCIRIIETNVRQKINRRAFYRFIKQNDNSIYFAAQINGELYIYENDNVNFKSNSFLSFYNIEIKKVDKSVLYLPLIYYYIDITCGENYELVSRIFINYKTSTIIFYYYKINSFSLNVNFNITLENEEIIVFNENSIELKEQEYSQIVRKEKFQITDKLNIQLSNSNCQIDINNHLELRNYNRKINYFMSFDLTDIGLMKLSDSFEFDIVKSDVMRIRQFMTNYMNCLNTNVFYQRLLNHYAHLLISKGYSPIIVRKWLLPDDIPQELQRAISMNNYNG
ncbi:DNA-directed RNA polymerase subunit beta''-like [Leptopilina boulardi]|uniref:DNA-directed RNA polymerase subunit beta''-like n=1 Tax=Leptopilina boulardi TaxID=63433 RepID=UPI0021F5C8D5|nr:DNA-directed RNA polymerase subunit beta''-like [Leptopilina boulardi]